MPEGEKVCCACGQALPLSDFGRDRRTATGTKSSCRVCERVYMQEYRLLHREELAAYNQEYHQTHKAQIGKRKQIYKAKNADRIKAYRHEYDATHLESHRERMKFYRATDPERYRAISRACYYQNKEKRNEDSRAYYQAMREERLVRAADYRRAHKEQILTGNQNRKTREKGLEGFFTTEQWSTLCSFFSGICPCCGEETQFVRDHIIPVSVEGATNWITNLQTLCAACNASKHTRTVDYRPDFVKTWAEKQVYG